MNSRSHLLRGVATAVVVTFAAGTEEPAGHSHEKCELHGGEVIMTQANHFEVLFTEHEARLYAYDGNQVPIPDLSAAKATLALESRSGKSVTVPMTYQKPDSAAGRTQGVLVARHEFTAADAKSTKALFHIAGLGTAPVEFKSPVVLGSETIYTCPMHPDVTAEDPGRCPRCGMNLVKRAPAESRPQGTEHRGAPEHPHS